MAKRRGGVKRSGSRYRMSPKRRAALRKAQLVSARKRKGKGLSRNKKIAIGAVGVLGAGIAAHKITKSQFSITVGKYPDNDGMRAKPPTRNGIRVFHKNWGVSKADIRARHRGISPDKPRLSGHRDVQVTGALASRFIRVSWKYKGGQRKFPQQKKNVVTHTPAESFNQVTGLRHGVLIMKPGAKDKHTGKSNQIRI